LQRVSILIGTTLTTRAIGCTLILRHAGFWDINDEDKHDLGAAEIGIRIPTKLDDLQLDFVAFVEKNRLEFRSVIGSVDLSAF